MEATTATRPLTGEKAQRIIDAMRTSVARRGVAGSTFEHVAREAGVSRGLLHYYFATKERLLVEVVRRDCDLRMEVLAARLGEARTADELVDRLVSSLEAMLRDEPEFVPVLFEFFTLSRRNDEIAVEFAELLRRTRAHLSGMLAAKQEEGVLTLAAGPEEVSDVLFALADGMAMRMLGEPGRDRAGMLRVGELAVRSLVV